MICSSVNLDRFISSPCWAFIPKGTLTYTGQFSGSRSTGCRASMRTTMLTVGLRIHPNPSLDCESVDGGTLCP